MDMFLTARAEAVVCGGRFAASLQVQVMVVKGELTG